MPQVTFTNVTKRYSDKTAAVIDFNLSIGDREYVCLLGPSGCGKSSTLRMLAGLETVSSGEIALNGKRINEVPPRERNMSMVFENYALYPHLNVFNNIAMPLAARGVPRRDIRHRVSAVAALLELGSMVDMWPYQLSGGQRQRVAVGRAIVREPEMFLLDEPYGHLEAYLRAQLRTEIRRLHERLGATTVHITHDQEEAAAVSDRIAIMDKGRLQQVGTVLELLDSPVNRFVAEFIGNPSINILPAEIIEESDQVGVTLGGSIVALPSQRWAWLKHIRVKGPLHLGIRPEDIRVELSAADRGLPARITALEPQGSYCVLIAETAIGTVTSRVPLVTAPGLGSAVRLIVDAGKVHLFDREGDSLHVKCARSISAGAQ